MITKKYLEQHTHALQNESRCRVVVVLDDELVDDTTEAGEEDVSGGPQLHAVVSLPQSSITSFLQRVRIQILELRRSSTIRNSLYTNPHMKTRR